MIDALRYWANEMGVDGFRFDLATILGRHADGFSADHPLLHTIGEDAQLNHVKLIAEPWDPGPGGYHLGQFPDRWAEWNDKFRDTARRFWRGDPGMNGEFARRLHGSADVFDSRGRAPFASVNFITAHDGFTLADVVSYEQRHNEANGENNRDGHAHNFSCNHGVEGPSDDASVLLKRRRHRLNLLATLLFSQGTPMLLAGDEFGHTQQGNNNAYAQDNEIGWLDWSALDEDPEFADDVRELIHLRKEWPLLRLSNYLHGETIQDSSVLNVQWLNDAGGEMDQGNWSGPARFKVLYGESSTDGDQSRVAILINNRDDAVEFRLPDGQPAVEWRVAWSVDAVDIGKDCRTIVAAPRSIYLLVASG